MLWVTGPGHRPPRLGDTNENRANAFHPLRSDAKQENKMQSERLRARPCSQRAGGEAAEPEAAGRAASPGRGQEAPRGSHGDTGAGPREGALGQPCTQARSTPGGAGILGSLLGPPQIIPGHPGSQNGRFFRAFLSLDGQPAPCTWTTPRGLGGRRPLGCLGPQSRLLKRVPSLHQVSGKNNMCPNRDKSQLAVPTGVCCLDRGKGPWDLFAFWVI